ncbi:MAG: UDP-N-acetylmuramoyl-L-alanyl-D-glutamate--2,6-diaminopimelate ligase [Parcubacteria group bacterium]|nr:UDP-N-acetylmuramoyl-L-alanyl-D-glutamate--2,6-diaminopimelate ligase [Parcubacteria group bacterium]
MKRVIKRLLPKFVIRLYHWKMAVIGAFLFGHPSREMIVIGVTGTKGKSTTSYFIAKILEEAGYKVGLTSTAIFKVGKKEWLNPTKMTMLGRLGLQKLLKDMVQAGCRYVVVETSSEGILQSRHIGIDYDVAVFTNLTPEHLESHGGFENYKKAKGKLFARLSKGRKKKLDGKLVPKIIVANADDKHAEYFLKFKADEKIKFGFENLGFDLSIPGKMNVYNALASIAVTKALGVDKKIAKSALQKIKTVPGRMEFIEEGQNFQVIVDYAHEVESFKKLYEVVDGIPHKKVIHVFGATGGGRDKSRRSKMGKIASENADTVIITTDDPYDEDPAKISEDVIVGIKNKEKTLNIVDRKEAIEKAIKLAEKDDIVLITGKGCEQAMCVARGKKIPWDDRKIIKQFLK